MSQMFSGGFVYVSNARYRPENVGRPSCRSASFSQAEVALEATRPLLDRLPVQPER